jgi:hypothetical protein
MVETALSAGRLRPKLIAVWVLLFVLVGAIAIIELTGGSEETGAEVREKMLLPVAVEQVGAIELAHEGTLHRFERDTSTGWFYHGMHTGAESAHEHLTDPANSAQIEKAFAGLGRARIERQFDAPRVNDYGVAVPKLLILVYRPQETTPLIQYAVGDLAPDQQSRYVQAVGSATVSLIASYQVEDLLELLNTAKTWSASSQLGTAPEVPRQ